MRLSHQEFVEKRQSIAKELNLFCRQHPLQVSEEVLQYCAYQMLNDHLLNTRTPHEVEEDNLKAEQDHQDWLTGAYTP